MYFFFVILLHNEYSSIIEISFKLFSLETLIYFFLPSLSQIGFFLLNFFSAKISINLNPNLEAYVQQLISQGYDEKTARAYAEQYRDRF